MQNAHRVETAGIYCLDSPQPREFIFTTFATLPTKTSFSKQVSKAYTIMTIVRVEHARSWTNHFRRVTINMDVVSQECINMINAGEVQELLKRDGVRHASFGQAVADSNNNNGNKLANGYISKLEITGFSQVTKNTSRWDKTRRWDCDVSIAYNVVQEFTTMDDAEKDGDFSRPPIQAVNDLRQQFATKYGV